MRPFIEPCPAVPRRPPADRLQFDHLALDRVEFDQLRRRRADRQRVLIYCSIAAPSSTDITWPPRLNRSTCQPARSWPHPSSERRRTDASRASDRFLGPQRSATPSCPLGPTVRLTARSPKRLFHLVLESHDTRAPGADSEEKHEPVSDIDTVVVDSLKALDPEWPIREADIPPAPVL